MVERALCRCSQVARLTKAKSVLLPLHCDDGVHICWAGPDRHRSVFPQALLAAHAAPSALYSFHNDVPVAPWPTASALLAASGPDLEVPYDELATPRGLLRALTQLQRTGLLFLRDVPSTAIKDRLGQRFYLKNQRQLIST
jgi:hypothetical protein